MYFHRKTLWALNRLKAARTVKPEVRLEAVSDGGSRPSTSPKLPTGGAVKPELGGGGGGGGGAVHWFVRTSGASCPGAQVQC
jgi:hypothetical protein